MNTQEFAKKLAIFYKMPRAEKYDIHLRDYDKMVEVIGYVDDPNYDINEFKGREMLFPKRWITIGIVPEYEVM